MSKLLEKHSHCPSATPNLSLEQVGQRWAEDGAATSFSRIQDVPWDYSKKKKEVSHSVNCFCIFSGPFVFIFVDCVNLLWGMSSPCASLVQGRLTWLCLSNLYNSALTYLIWLSGVSAQTCSQNHHFDPLLSFDFLKNSLSDERVQSSEQNIGVFSAEVWVCWKCTQTSLSPFSQPQ